MNIHGLHTPFSRNLRPLQKWAESPPPPEGGTLTAYPK
jgi:hypothetical protein